VKGSIFGKNIVILEIDIILTFGRVSTYEVNYVFNIKVVMIVVR